MRWPELFFKNKPQDTQPVPLGVPRPITPPRTAAQAAAEQDAIELAEAERAMQEREASQKLTSTPTEAPNAGKIQIGPRLLPQVPTARVSLRPTPPLASMPENETQRLSLVPPLTHEIPQAHTMSPASPATTAPPSAPLFRSVVLPSRKNQTTPILPSIAFPPATSVSPMDLSPEGNPEDNAANLATTPIPEQLITAAAPRRRARLADVARTAPALPRREELLPDHLSLPPVPAPEETSAVVPPSFPVPSSLAQVPDPVSGLTTTDLAEQANPALEPQPETAKFPPFPEKEPLAASPKDPHPLSTQNLAPAESSGERREFLLTNGERILGRVLSESPDEIYLHNESLGVLTIPRHQIATNLVEVILINGDRIVGNIVAETAETIYVRHASLGTLTIPRSQRSTRVVEVLLKNGDRIVGEVLSETENFTVIRSAALGTMAVQHQFVEMLNRKVEQIQIKSILPSLPAPPTHSQG